MLLIIKKVCFLVGLTLYVISANSQTVTSTRNGVWNDPMTWSGGFIPSSANATQIIIDHEVEIPSPFAVSVFRLVVNNKLTLKASSQLSLLPDALPDIPDLLVIGTLVCQDNALLNGTSTLNTRFESGSFYVHQQGPLGFIPYGTWDKGSTLIINGFRDTGYINIAHSDSWKQSFGNVIYDCPQQTIFVVDLNGYLRNITGDFIVKNTNNKTLRLSTTQNPLINIGGNLIVQGTSEVWFSTSGTNTQVYIQQDFKYLSLSSGPSYFTTRGVTTINVRGNMELNSPGLLRMASSSPDSLGARRAVLNLSSNLTIITGQILAPPLGSGSGRIVFNGTADQIVTTSPSGVSFQGNLDYVIGGGSSISLGNSALSNTSGSLLVNGTIGVGSADPLGAIQLGNKGNILISGPRSYAPGSTIIYNGNSAQSLGNGHPSNPSINVIISNPTETKLLQNLLCSDLQVEKGAFDAGGYNVTVNGDLICDSTAVLSVGTIRLEGDRNQTIAVKGSALGDITINKLPGSTVALLDQMSIRGILQIETPNITLNSNGNLTLLSTSDNGNGTARIGPLPVGSKIMGDVTVQRYMSAEGRIYRYISSPVKNASIASLMDDFPVTGRFSDPSGNSKRPSFYYYDESQGSLQGGWISYPGSGLAINNPLEPGRGYCTLIRDPTNSVTWDVTGELTQGDVIIPLAMTGNNAPSNGWNLVGNPYACTIDWDIDGPTGWTKQDLSPIICIRDNGIGGWGTVRYWDGDINYSEIPEGQIAAGQSIWVKATGPNPILIAREGIKVSNDGAFYRRKPMYIPSFVLELSQGEFHDRAYYKVRPGARGKLDVLDAVKIANDNLDISTFSDDSVSLAINAHDSLPCGTSFIPVRLADLNKGSCRLELQAKFDFNSYTYTWIDNYLQTKKVLIPGKSIDWEITDKQMSKPNRFALRLDEIMPEDSLFITAPERVCNDQAVAVLIKAAQPGIYYSVWDANGSQLTEEVLGEGSDLKIDLSPDSIGAGQHALKILAHSACQRVNLLPVINLTKEVPVLKITDGYACQGDTVTLSAKADVADMAFNWFEAGDSNDTLATTASLSLPSLIKPRTYYVSGTIPSGCTTRRYPVKANVIHPHPARILWQGSNVLLSNHAINNRWYWNNVFIGKDRLLPVNESGNYTLRVDTLGCTSSDTVRFIVKGVVAPDVKAIDIYPNPVKDEFLLFPLDSPATLDIVNAAGMNVEGFRTVSIAAGENSRVSLKSLTAGIYFAIIRDGQRKRMIRLVKVD